MPPRMAGIILAMATLAAFWLQPIGGDGLGENGPGD
jgi:hypothetical protein